MRGLVVVACCLLVASRAGADPFYVRAGHGVWKIDGTSAKRVIVDKADELYILAVDRDGDVWAGGNRVVGAKKKQIVVRMGKGDEVVAMTRAAKGGMWVLGRDELLRITERGKTTRYKYEDTPITHLNRAASIVEVGDDLWLASERGVHRFNAGTWTEERNDDDGLCSRIARDTLGTMWAVCSDTGHDVLVAKIGDKWQQLTTTDYMHGFAAGQDGRVIAPGLNGLWVATHVGSKIEWTAKDVRTVRVQWPEPEVLRRAAIDDAERIWYMRDASLVVADRTGKELASYPVGTVPGMRWIVTGVAVVGAGPTDLPARAEVVKGTIKGRLVDENKKPLANRELHLCADTCEEGKPNVTFTTDAKGTFSVTAPALELDIIADLDAKGNGHLLGKSLVTPGSHPHRPVYVECCTQLDPKKTLDLGTIKVLNDL